VAVSVGSLALSAGCGSRPQTSDIDFSQVKPESVAEADAGPYAFASVAEMAATSQVIVEGRVVGIERGRQAGAEDNDPGLGLRDARIVVENVLKGDPATEIWIEEYGFDRKEQAFEIAHQPWSIVGDEGIYFLIGVGGNQPPDHYQMVNADGRVLLDGDKTLTFAPSRMAAELRSLPPDRAREAVLAGVREAEDLGMRPQQPYSVRVRDVVDDAPEARGGQAPVSEEPGEPTPEGYSPCERGTECEEN